MANTSEPRMRPVKMGPTAVEVRRGEGGVLYVRSPEPLGPYATRLIDKFDEWADRAPERVFLADRGEDGAWRKIVYAEARETARSIAQSILNLGLSLERPVGLLSGNSLEHGLIALGALYAGVPYAPVTPAYSLISTDFAKLKHVFGLTEPGLVYVADPAPFKRALDAIMRPGMTVVAGRNAAAWDGAIPFNEFAATPATVDVAAATEAVGPDSIVKFLFTSGSTGMPKAVINTMRMWCADQVMLHTSLAFLKDEPPVMVDWLPWNHTAGSNHNFGLTIYNGGTLHIDDGTPTSGGIEKTVRNLKEVAPTLYINVPKGYEMLCDHFDRDEALRRNFFSRVKVLQYSGAGMNQHTWNRLREIGVKTCGEHIRMITGYGSTETGPFAFGPNHVVERPGMVGIPAVGLEVKLVPHGGKMEVRLRGPNITPGYWRQPEKTEEAFDEEGFYKMGDALRFADEDDPEQGFVFDGRVTEDFKLSTATWVDMAGVRAKLIAALAPYIRDAVLTGLNRNFIGALLVPDMAACRALCGDVPTDAGDAAVATHPALRRHVQEALANHARKATGSSNRVERVTILVEPPSLDTQEMTEKGSLNQAAVLARREPLVEELYADPPAAHVIVARETVAG